MSRRSICSKFGSVLMQGRYHNRRHVSCNGLHSHSIKMDLVLLISPIVQMRRYFHTSCVALPSTQEWVSRRQGPRIQTPDSRMLTVARLAVTLQDETSPARYSSLYPQELLLMNWPHRLADLTTCLHLKHSK